MHISPTVGNIIRYLEEEISCALRTSRVHCSALSSRPLLNRIIHPLFRTTSRRDVCISCFVLRSGITCTGKSAVSFRRRLTGFHKSSPPEINLIGMNIITKGDVLLYSVRNCSFSDNAKLLLVRSDAYV